MKIIKTLTKIFLIPALLVAPLATFDCFAEVRGPEDKAVQPPASQVSSALESRKERLSYAMGMALGTQLRKQSVEVDLELYVQGLRDALSGGKTLLTEKETLVAIKELQNELKKKQAAPEATAELSGIAVSFKLDPLLTRGMYMGDRWVSPPTYTSIVHEGKELTVEARAHWRDAKGETRKVSPEWITEDPEMVTVTPAQGDEVRITVRRAGQSKLKVAAGGVAKELIVRAKSEGDTIQVEISQ